MQSYAPMHKFCACYCLTLFLDQVLSGTRIEIGSPCHIKKNNKKKNPHHNLKTRWYIYSNWYIQELRVFLCVPFSIYDVILILPLISRKRYISPKEFVQIIETLTCSFLICWKQTYFQARYMKTFYPAGFSRWENLVQA